MSRASVGSEPGGCLLISPSQAKLGGPAQATESCCLLSKWPAKGLTLREIRCSRLQILRNTQLTGALCSSGPLVAPLVLQDVRAANHYPDPKRKAILTRHSIEES